jgi:hypothetical protein
LVRDGAIWDVYVSTTAQNGAPNITRLEFEGKGPAGQRLRHTRPLEGALLDALHSGDPISRARLEEELDLAFRDAAGPSEPAEPAEPTEPTEPIESTEPADPIEPTDPPVDDPQNSP